MIDLNKIQEDIAHEYRKHLGALPPIITMVRLQSAIGELSKIMYDTTIKYIDSEDEATELREKIGFIISSILIEVIQISSKYNVNIESLLLQTEPNKEIGKNKLENENNSVFER